MTAILTFQKFLFKSLNECEAITTRVSGIFASLPEYIRYPYIKLASFYIETWASHHFSGRVFNLSFEVIADDATSQPCIEIMEMLEEFITQNRVVSPDFLVAKAKVLGSKLHFIKTDRLWVGEVKAKFWIETVH